MRTLLGTLGIIAAVILALAADSYAGHGRGGGWGSGGAYIRMFNPASVVTVTGDVVRIERFTPIKGMSQGVHIVIRTGTGDETVHLGPAWYIDNQDNVISSGDKVTVTGSKVKYDGGQVIIAAEVKKDEETLVLRDKAGIPLWSGWRRR